MVSYTNWDDEEPDEDDGKSCVYMSHDTGKWSASPCAAHMNWMCKIPRGKWRIAKEGYRRLKRWK